MKKVVVFGSTGSVGKNALSVIEKDPKNFKVVGLCANRDVKTLIRQIKQFKPNYVCVRDEKSAKTIKNYLPKKIKLFKGYKGMDEFCSLKSDISCMAISGISCLRPLLLNLKHTKRVALANKESIVAAGSLVFSAAKKYNTEIIPVDSEINALFQLFDRKKDSSCLRKVYLTASGGSLSSHKQKDLKRVTVNQVLKHPTWNMGRRITIDSATLVNKGFEVIETHFFFKIPYKDIDIVIHKESFAHALCEYKDNTLLGCLYPPDMKKPISFSLYYPRRQNVAQDNVFDKAFSISFSPINYSKFPLLKLILKAAKKKDNSLAILNACDEVAIDYFLKKKIKFTDIFRVMDYLFRRYPSSKIKSIEDVFYWDDWARHKTKNYIDRL